MTHDKLILLHEAATAGWHGAKARDAMLGLSDNHAEEAVHWAAYHARMAASAARRAIAAAEEL